MSQANFTPLLNLNQEAFILNLNRRKFLQLGAYGTFALMSGCVTESLFKDHQYDEYIDSALISSDGKKIAIISENFHYIFDAPVELKPLFDSPLRSKVSADIGHFMVDKDNTIRGSLNIWVNVDKFSNEERQAYEKLGFKTDRNVMFLKEKLEGKRYRARSELNIQNKYKLNKEYQVSIVAVQSDLEKTSKIPLTPITVAIDGTLVIATIVLIPFIALILLTHSATAK